MRNTSRIIILFLFVLALIPISTTAHAQSIKARMAARIPTITAMKNKGIVGENNQGLLEYRGAKRPNKNVVAAENHDRQTVYAAIARKAGTTPALVGQRRARKLAEIGLKGQWFQSPNGKWYRK
jgi:uncharacterized protein